MYTDQEIQVASTRLISNKREWNHCFIKNAPKICKTKTKLETNQNILLLTLSIFIEHGTVAQKLDHLICNSRVLIGLLAIMCFDLLQVHFYLYQETHFQVKDIVRGLVLKQRSNSERV